MTAPLPPQPTPPPFVELPRFTRDSLPLGPWETFRKKTLTPMIRINGPFVVETIHGPVVCRDGWLARDNAGNPYPIAADEQPRAYEPAEEIE